MKSVWKTGSGPRSDRQPLHGSQGFDVTVIGAGITGLTTALMLMDAGRRVAVVEAMAIGGGCTAGSTGNLYGTVSKRLSSLARKWDKDIVRALVAERLRAIDTIEATIRRFEIDCEFARVPMYLGTGLPDSQSQQALEDEYRMSVDAGLDASLVSAVPGLALPIHRAVRIENQAQFNPLRYARGLADAVIAEGGVIYENSKVSDVDAGRGLVTTTDGEIKTRSIVYATHTPKGINLLQTTMEPYREYGVAAEVDGVPDSGGIYWMLDRTRSLRFYSHAGKHYLIIVGEKHKTGEGELGDGYYRLLQDYGRTNFGVGDFQYAWSAQQYSPADGLPYIGRSGHDNVYIATGFSSDGLVWGTLAGRVIADMISGVTSEFAQIVTPRRFTPIKSAKGWFKENASVAAHLARDYLSPVRTRELDRVAAGEGRIVEIDGDRLAVYRAPDGTMSALSPVCPHLKCMVSWNSADSTWDCPCHGSRFDIDGTVIEGPAYEGLAPRALPR